MSENACHSGLGRLSIASSQGPPELWDRGPGIGRPGLYPFPQPAVVEGGEIALGDRPAPHAVDRRAEDRVIAVPAPGHIATLRAPPALQERQQDEVARAQFVGVAARVGLAGPSGDPVGASGAPQEELERRAIGLGPGADLRVGFGPGACRGRSFIARRQWKAAAPFVRSPEEGEGVLVVGDAEGADRRDIERVADVREPVQTRQPPDREGRTGDRKPDRQDEHDPRELAEPLAQQLTQLGRRRTRRRGTIKGDIRRWHRTSSPDDTDSHAWPPLHPTASGAGSTTNVR